MKTSNAIGSLALALMLSSQGPLHSILYQSYLPVTIHMLTEPVMFIEDTGVIHRVRKRLYPFFYFFLGAQCVESGVSCTDYY